MRELMLTNFAPRNLAQRVLRSGGAVTEGFGPKGSVIAVAISADGSPRLGRQQRFLELWQPFHCRLPTTIGGVTKWNGPN